ncbi:MAG: DUF2147 domain-containing protein [Rhodopila sp.]|nr:DUF2147 domain-containing protein [Rhodopila sp.]
MLRPLALVFLLLSAHAAEAAATVTGFWLTQGGDGVIAISPCGDHLCGRLVAFFLDHPSDRTPVDYRGVSQCHLALISDARQIGANLWKGHITNPKNGKVYGVELRLDPSGNLALRGFLGVPLLGRTQTWTRYAGKVPADCRIYAPNPVPGQSSALPVEPEQAQ